MKKLVLVLALSISSLGWAGPRSEQIKSAVEALSACGNFIRYDDSNVYTGFGTYWTGHEQPRRPQANTVRVVSIEGQTKNRLQTLDSAVDLLTYNDSTYILTFSGIEEWDLKNLQRKNVYKTHFPNTNFEDEQHARAFARYQDKLIIAHGRLGVSFFDLKNKIVTNAFKLIKGQRPLESTANGVAISGKYAFVIMDSYTLVEKEEKPPFQGIVVIDMETETIVNELVGLNPAADSAVADDKTLIVSYYGMPLWKYSVGSLMGSQLPKAPLKNIWKFPWAGHPTGKAAIDDMYYFTCFSRMPNQGEGPYPIKMPVAMDRRKLILD